jgi:replicative DNA helicase
MHNEDIFLSACLHDSEIIDRAISEGVRRDTFSAPKLGAIWNAVVEQRAKGQIADMATVFLAMGKDCPAAELMHIDGLHSSIYAGTVAMRKMLWSHQIATLKPALKDTLSMLEKETEPGNVIKQIEGLQQILKPQENDVPSLDKIIGEVELWAKEEIAGDRKTKDLVMTGLPTFDNYAQPIEAHEYVVVGARTSIGKSSFMTQICGHNLKRGLRVAYFTLETSAAAVIKQIAGQRAKVNLRAMGMEMGEKQREYFAELEKLKKQHLRVFDRDLSITQIESRARLLASTWKPQLVIVDYLGLIRGTEGSAYERMGALSKAMIPLRKSLGCSLIVAAQLNRGNEREDRPPTRTDFRDAGSIEEDAHRIVALHRPSKDAGGNPQELGQSVYDYELLQLKLRDGPLASSRIKYFAPHTRFYEETA